MQVDVLGDLHRYGQVNSYECIRCLKCTDECPTGAIAFQMLRNGNIRLNTDAAIRAETATLERRRLSVLDVVISLMWIGTTLFFTFTARQSAPQEIKVTMAAGLLLVIYCVVRITQKGWSRVFA